MPRKTTPKPTPAVRQRTKRSAPASNVPTRDAPRSTLPGDADRMRTDADRAGNDLSHKKTESTPARIAPARQRYATYWARHGRRAGPSLGKRRNVAKHLAFLEAFSRTGVISEAARIVGMDDSYVRRLIINDERFAAAFAEAEAIATDKLVTAARQRAIEGYERPIYQRGELVGYETNYSDRLLEILLKAKLPDEFGDFLRVKMEPSWISVLERRGLSASDAFRMLMDELSRDDAATGTPALPASIPLRAEPSAAARNDTTGDAGESESENKSEE